jgi:hypothetical protein
MKRFLIAVALAVTTIVFNTEIFADKVGQPGFYGRINTGGYRQPRVLYRQPMAIEHAPINRAPIYLRVPSGHARQWKKHCRAYNACAERVFFVQDTWYNRKYGTRYPRHQRGNQNNGPFKHRGGQNGMHRGNTQGRSYRH